MVTIEIDPRENGIHSFAMALEAIKNLEDSPDNKYYLKDSILRSHHALETLFKDILFQVNPVLLLSSKQGASDIKEAYVDYFSGNGTIIVDDLWTINLEETIKVIKKLGLMRGLEDKELTNFLESIRELTRCRNAIQHLAISIDDEVVKRILGNTLPISLKILQATYDDLSKTDIRLISPMKSIFGFGKISTSLKAISPHSGEYLQLLETEYNDLIQDAIKTFTGKKFGDEHLRLVIKDHGKVGAPPYYSELELQGYLNYKYNYSKIMIFEFNRRSKGEEDEKGNSPYWAKFVMGDHTFVINSTDPNESQAKGSFSLDGQIRAEKAEDLLSLKGLEKQIAALRGLTVDIRINLNYEAIALVHGVHFTTNKITKSDGFLNIKLTAFPKGYSEKKPELIGKYEAKLDEKNSSFQINAFLNQDNKIDKDHCIIDWAINSIGDLNF